MAKQSSMNQERNVFRGTKLSSAMKDLLGAVIRAFDSRRHMFEAASIGETQYHPETCLACDGTGFLLVPDEVSDSSDDDGPLPKVEEVDPVGLLSGNRAPSPADSDSSASDTSDHVSGGAHRPLQLPSKSVKLAMGLPHLAIPQSISVTTPVVTSGPQVTRASAASGPQVTPAAAAAPQVTTTVAIGAPVNLAPAPTYPISTIIPGFDSLGPNSSNPQPAPAPMNAVFTGPEERYYVITKGTRVGIFGGWQSTSPYVTGVASASFSRHCTLQTAFQAYETAFNRGSVVDNAKLNAVERYRFDCVCPRPTTQPIAFLFTPSTSVEADMPTISNTGLLSATRQADMLVFAIGLITVIMANGDVHSFVDESYCRFTILHDIPPTPPDINRAMYCAMHRLHVISAAFDLATRRRRRSPNPRLLTDEEWADHREDLREDLRTIIQNRLSLDRYANRPVSMADEPIHTTLYGGAVTRLRSGATRDGGARGN
ncbi:hypothetical protein D9611_008315 [Ephemerocybe angulata]|uniref:Ribonuclease H1 N-terminal domain-containing protein n=1 Tax=Ephemerocybe angulata TaxID=980116 RepID=A0A8H5BIR1_9AGAR|nr:hypothetical protein D9611_008315 [Tulosesus angulatus]